MVTTVSVVFQFLGLGLILLSFLVAKNIAKFLVMGILIFVFGLLLYLNNFLEGQVNERRKEMEN